MNKRHVIVSGGSRGLGEALVYSLLEDGYAVSAFSRRETEFTRRLSEECEDFLFVPTNIADFRSVDSAVAEATAWFGIPFGLINNAGVAYDGLLVSMTEDQISGVLDVNLKGSLLLTRSVTRRMLMGGGGGAILNITSIVGLRGYAGLAAYAATKSGLDGMTRALARELGDRHIRVNSIAPGFMETEMTHGLTEPQKRQIIRRTPLGRLGTVDDVTGLTLFLLSDASAFITGQIFTVDGGITC